MKKSKMIRVSDEFDKCLKKGAKDFGTKTEFSRVLANELEPNIFEEFKQKYMKKRKANLAINVLMFVIILFVFAVASIYWGVIQDELVTEINSDENTHQEAKDVLNNTNNNYASLFDGLVLFVLILFWILMLASSFFIDTHPVFFIISIILLLSSFVVMGILGNSFEEITQDGDILTMADQFPITNYIFSHVVEIAIVVAFSEAIVLYGKWRLFN